MHNKGGFQNDSAEMFEKIEFIRKGNATRYRRIESRDAVRNEEMHATSTNDNTVLNLYY